MTNIELRALREKLGLTQAKMAERLGIKTRMYCYAESGEKKLGRASVMLAERLAKRK